MPPRATSKAKSFTA